MFEWIKNITKEAPEFWKQYTTKFETKSNRYVVLSLETTGLNTKHDVIVSMGSISVIKNSIAVSDYFQVIIPQYQYMHDNAITNNFFIESSLEKYSENEAISLFINYLKNATLVGHRIHFDIEMINEALDKLNCGRLKNEALDVEIMHKKLNDINDKQFTIDELLKIYKIPKSDRLSSSDEAFNIALLFLKLKSKLGINF